jgi:6-phosphofructokinase
LPATAVLMPSCFLFSDVDYIDRSFGFESSVEAAQVAIRSAKTEAICNMPNGIGVVKLMGRSAGFLAGKWKHPKAQKSILILILTAVSS